ncbi:MAG: hypothetical protein V4450_13720 [Bacteroidota bacterium]
MFYGIGWIQYIRTITLVVLAYYLVIGWMYRKELLQWWREKKKP